MLLIKNDETGLEDLIQHAGTCSNMSSRTGDVKSCSCSNLSFKLYQNLSGVPSSAVDYSSAHVGISLQNEVQMSLGSVISATLLLMRKIHPIGIDLQPVLPIPTCNHVRNCPSKKQGGQVRSHAQSIHNRSWRSITCSDLSYSRSNHVSEF